MARKRMRDQRGWQVKVYKKVMNLPMDAFDIQFCDQPGHDNLCFTLGSEMHRKLRLPKDMVLWAHMVLPVVQF